MALLIFLFLFAYLFNNIVYVVHSGEGAVLYRLFFGGTVTDRVYTEGIYFIEPWDKMYIYNARIQEVPYKFDVLSKKGLKIRLGISIRYAPEYELLGVLHQKVGPDYLHTVIIPEVESVLRIIIGKMDAEEVYTTKTAVIEKAINEAIEQVSQRFIKVDDVIIKQIELPSSVEDSIRYKIEQKHLAEAYIFKLEREEREADRKRIEARGIRDHNKILQTSLSKEVMYWRAIQASLELSKSDNSKVVVVGGGKSGLPIFGSIPLDLPQDISVPLPKDVTGEEPADAETKEVMPPTGNMSDVSAESGADTKESPVPENTAGEEPGQTERVPNQ